MKRGERKEKKSRKEEKKGMICFLFSFPFFLLFFSFFHFKKGQKIVPQKMYDAQFEFAYPNLESAFREIVDGEIKKQKIE